MPDRTRTKRRLYSDEDIERLILLRRGTESGESISQLAHLSNEELRRMVLTSGPGSASDLPSTSPNGRSRYHRELCLQAIKNLDESALESRLLNASVELGRETLIEEVLQPLLQQTGELWNDGNLRVAHEHLASSVVRSLLGSIIVTDRPNPSAPLLLATTPGGQLHEFGALMAAVTATAVGWQAMYLGPNLPAEDIAAAVRQRRARAVALSIVYPPDDAAVEFELKKLARLLGTDTTILVGGRASASYRPVISQINAYHVRSLANLKERLNAIRNQPAQAQRNRDVQS